MSWINDAKNQAAKERSSAIEKEAQEKQKQKDLLESKRKSLELQLRQCTKKEKAIIDGVLTRAKKHGLECSEAQVVVSRGIGSLVLYTEEFSSACGQDWTQDIYIYTVCFEWIITEPESGKQMWVHLGAGNIYGKSKIRDGLFEHHYETDYNKVIGLKPVIKVNNREITSDQAEDVIKEWLVKIFR